MLQVNIATLKAKLSFYLSQVRKGREVLILDHRTPVAKIIASEIHSSGLRVTPAKKPVAALRDMKFKPVKLNVDIVDLLREDRDSR